MTVETLGLFNTSILILVELVLGFGLFWLGQLFYQKSFRRMALNEELFIRDNAAIAVALVGFYLGIADLILVPGVKISDEIVRQDIPNLGAGIIEAFAYIAASFLIQWTVSVYP
jgi:hypothetical protein